MQVALICNCQIILLQECTWVYLNQMQAENKVPCNWCISHNGCNKNKIKTMSKRIVKYISVMLLTAASHFCNAQYFQGLYDFDSSYDWGIDIFLQTDGTYLIYGT